MAKKKTGKSRKPPTKPSSSPDPSPKIAPVTLWRHHLAVCMGLVLLTVVVFWPSLSLGFVYDDAFRITELPHLSQTPSRALLRLRGLTYAFHLVDYHLWGDQAFGYHLTNLLLHSSAVIAAYGLVWVWQRNLPVALMTAALFAVHPIHVEAVVSFVNRKDMVAFLGTVVGITLLLSNKPNPRVARVGAALCLIAALAAKEVAVVGVFPFFLWALWQNHHPPFDQPARGKPWLPAALFGSLGFVAIAGAAAYGLFAEDSIRVLFGDELQDATGVVVQFLGNVPYQLSMALGTQPTAAEYPLLAGDALIARAVFGSLFLLLATVIVLFGTSRHPIRTAVAWFLLTWLPTANLIPLSPYFRADRYLYTPSLALCFAAAFALHTLSTRYKKPLWLPAVTLLIVVGGFLCRESIQPWRSEKALWQAALDNAGPTYRAHVILGSLAMQEQHMDLAEEHYRHALALRPNVYETHLRLMLVYAKNDRFAQAKPHAERVRAHVPNQPEALRVVAMSALLEQRWADAVEPFRMLFGQEPGRADVANNLAWLLSASPDTSLHRIKEAVIFGEKAVAVSKAGNPAYLYTLAVALARDGRGEAARQRLQEAKTLAERQGNQRLLQQINRLLTGP